MPNGIRLYRPERTDEQDGPMPTRTPGLGTRWHHLGRGMTPFRRTQQEGLRRFGRTEMGFPVRVESPFGQAPEGPEAEPEPIVPRRTTWRRSRWEEPGLPKVGKEAVGAIAALPPVRPGIIPYAPGEGPPIETEMMPYTGEAGIQPTMPTMPSYWGEGGDAAGFRGPRTVQPPVPGVPGGVRPGPAVHPSLSQPFRGAVQPQREARTAPPTPGQLRAQEARQRAQLRGEARRQRYQASLQRMQAGQTITPIAAHYPYMAVGGAPWSGPRRPWSGGQTGPAGVNIMPQIAGAALGAGTAGIGQGLEAERRMQEQWRQGGWAQWAATQYRDPRTGMTMAQQQAQDKAQFEAMSPEDLAAMQASMGPEAFEAYRQSLYADPAEALLSAQELGLTRAARPMQSGFFGRGLTGRPEVAFRPSQFRAESVGPRRLGFGAY